MKKPFLILLSIVIVFTLSCKKENSITPLDLSSGDYFIFGEYAGFCSGNCARFFVIKDNNIYSDLNEYFYSADSLKFNSSPLEVSKYNIAAPLLTDFPTYLYLDNHKNETFGCPDCTDGGAVYIILKQDGIITHWNVDNFIQNQPEEIRDYIARMHTVIADLQ